MLGYIWAGMIIFSYIFSILTGRTTSVTEAALSGAADAVSLTISMLGITCFWSGIMEIAKKSNLTEKIAKIMSPLISRLFPDISKNSPAYSAIIMNIIANLLGLSNAATPLGLRAMAELKRENNNKPLASDAMCMFVLINTASVTLIPSTVIALRAASGSFYPFEIILPAWISSFCTLFAGIALYKFLTKRSQRRNSWK